MYRSLIVVRVFLGGGGKSVEDGGEVKFRYLIIMAKNAQSCWNAVTNRGWLYIFQTDTFMVLLVKQHYKGLLYEGCTLNT